MPIQLNNLDPEVIKSVKLLNQIVGVKTISSCSGHGSNLCYVIFTCSNSLSLHRIIKAVLTIRFQCSDKFDPEIHLWIVKPWINNNLGIVWNIEWQLDDGLTKRGDNIKMVEAWQALEQALGRITNQLKEE